MTKASATGQIIVTSNGTTIHTALQCTLGDLYQNYDGDWNKPTAVSPNFEASGTTGPTLVFQAFSAEAGSGVLNLSNASSTTWEIAGVTLSFNDNTGVSTTSFNGTTGHFTRGADSSGNPKLTVNKNLIGVNSGNSFNITCKVMASVGNTARELSASFPVYIAQGVDNSKRVNIIATSEKNLFTITEKGGTCTVKAVVTDGVTVPTSGYTFRWYLLGADGEFVLKQNSASDTYTVNETDVDSSAMVKVEAYIGSTLYASDVQTINDVSDEYVLFANPTDGNKNAVAENFVANSNSKIVYEPFICKRGSTAHLTGVTFTMKLYSQVGVDISSLVTASNNTFTILESKIRGYQGVQYLITGVG